MHDARAPDDDRAGGEVGIANDAEHVPQALLAGTCPIAYDCDGTPEVVRDRETGLLVPTGDVAKLREVKTDAKPVVFRINMEAGHGGKSGRFQRYKESAEQFAYMLEVLGVK